MFNYKYNEDTAMLEKDGVKYEFLVLIVVAVITVLAIL